MAVEINVGLGFVFTSLVIGGFFSFFFFFFLVSARVGGR